jgi:hypothetical protein
MSNIDKIARSVEFLDTGTIFDYFFTKIESFKYITNPVL